MVVVVDEMQQRFGFRPHRKTRFLAIELVFGQAARIVRERHGAGGELLFEDVVLEFNSKKADRAGGKARTFAQAQNRGRANVHDRDCSCRLRRRQCRHAGRWRKVPERRRAFSVGERKAQRIILRRIDDDTEGTAHAIDRESLAGCAPRTRESAAGFGSTAPSLMTGFRSVAD